MTPTRLESPRRRGTERPTFFVSTVLFGFGTGDRSYRSYEVVAPDPVEARRVVRSFIERTVGSVIGGYRVESTRQVSTDYRGYPVVVIR